MRIVYMGNGWLAYTVLKYLVSKKANIIGLVVHPKHKAGYTKEMEGLLNLLPRQIILGRNINYEAAIEQIKLVNPDLILTVGFGHILQESIINIPTKGCINLHTSYLPFNRGANPNIWSIVDKTPAGVTLHYIDKGIDTGEIIAQREVEIESIDTGETLYKKLEKEALELFKDYWNNVYKKNIKQTGNYHATKDTEKIDHINLNSEYTARRLINIIRARTFPPYKGAYFIDRNGKKVYMRLELMYEEDMKDGI